MKNDPDQRLPQEALLKLAALVTEADESRALELHTKKRIDDLINSLHGTSDPTVFANLEAEISRQRSVMAGHLQRHRSAADLHARLRGWLVSQPPHLRFGMVPPMRLRSKVTIDDLGKDIADTRENITALKRKRDEVKNAPPPKKILIDQAKKKVEQLQERGKPNVKINGGALTVDFADPKGFATNSERIAALLAWFRPDIMLERLTEMVDALPNANNGLPPIEREKRLAALTQEIDALERNEEGLIVAAAERGQIVWRRGDASPKAVLGIEIKTAKAAAA